MVRTYTNAMKAPTPQKKPLVGREKEMEKNAAGGYVFSIDDWARLRRFLILGTEGGTYYVEERKHTLENVQTLLRCIAEDGVRVVNEIVAVSQGGLAPKNDPAVFALAVASVKGNDATRHAALDALPAVCRIGTHLFQFAEARQAVGGGWGRGVRNAIGDWYLDKSIDALVHQLLKYRQRDGWSHRDLLRLAHPCVATGAALDTQEVVQRAAVLDAACAPNGGQRQGPSVKSVAVAAYGAGARVERITPVRSQGGGWPRVAEFSRLAQGYLLVNEQMKKVESGVPVSQVIRDVAQAVSDFRLERELVPTAFLSAPQVQEAMLPHLGYMALIRNLANMSRSGLLKPLSMAESYVMKRLGDAEALCKSRVHPFALLLAARTYAAGHGVRSRGEPWLVSPNIVGVLDQAFLLAFGNIEPTNKKYLLAIDVSGSMSMDMGGSVITAAEAAAAMAMATLRVEPQTYAFGFSTRFVDLKLTARDSLPDVLRKTVGMTFGGTDAAVAVQHAIDHKLEVDVFAVYSDGETWAGNEHTSEELRRYRNVMNRHEARFACVNFVASRTSLADLQDPRSMDFVGLDASLPQALAAFAKGC